MLTKQAVHLGYDLVKITHLCDGHTQTSRLAPKLTGREQAPATVPWQRTEPAARGPVQRKVESDCSSSKPLQARPAKYKEYDQEHNRNNEKPLSGW